MQYNLDSVWRHDFITEKRPLRKLVPLQREVPTGIEARKGFTADHQYHLTTTLGTGLFPGRKTHLGHAGRNSRKANLKQRRGAHVFPEHICPPPLLMRGGLSDFNSRVSMPGLSFSLDIHLFHLLSQYLNHLFLFQCSSPSEILL